MKGRFIVVEGIDGAGKTTTLEQMLKLFGMENVICLSGFRYDTLFGKLAKQNPESIYFYLDFLIDGYKKIKPLLDAGKTVVQDRYVQSVDSYLPDSSYLCNKIARVVLSPFFQKPNVYVYFTVSLDECVKRLSSSKQAEKYHELLVANQNRIIQRKENYERIYEKMTCQKYKIDTTGKIIEESANELAEILRRTK